MARLPARRLLWLPGRDAAGRVAPPCIPGKDGQPACHGVCFPASGHYTPAQAKQYIRPLAIGSPRNMFLGLKEYLPLWIPMKSIPC